MACLIAHIESGIFAGTETKVLAAAALETLNGKVKTIPHFAALINMFHFSSSMMWTCAQKLHKQNRRADQSNPSMLIIVKKLGDTFHITESIPLSSLVYLGGNRDTKCLSDAPHVRVFKPADHAKVIVDLCEDSELISKQALQKMEKKKVRTMMGMTRVIIWKDMHFLKNKIIK
ncbi:hypothetical protein PRIPAC_72283 [Pristionchus pacificus]|uniref:Uncharacterized protein n=1 Tax=Pristionchus pacificus TaxID=54126 RepID=A0A2A6C7J6_PRIPA|nr:hypothetical protein PRIPAC_72283 [Pristionchus pacificus]|eukprot:PDM74011.1 hypothetical protein PRIPAC_41367 [Pristionchus pacificus]